MKYNPFKPNDIVHQGMFVGRLDEINNIERSLFQAKHGNPQHFLVIGERGIGKSSLLFYVKVLADGLPIAPDERMNFMTVPVDLGGCTTQLDVIRKIGRGFRTALSRKQQVREKIGKIWDWVTNWEVLGVQYHKEDRAIDFEEICEEFVTHLAEFCDLTSNDMDGVVFLIDEADRPPVEANLGLQLKMITERLTWASCDRVLFGLAGLPPLLSKLRDSHESSPRLFQIMHLEPLELDERIRVVNLGLEEANSRNAVKTTITEEGIEFLADLSEGYPHFVQQFSYSAFEHDKDNIIDVEDVGDAAFKDGGALSQLGDKFFSEMYHARISSEEYRRVLDAMADHGDQWVTRKTIIAESGVSETNVTNALQALKAKSVILQDDTRRGVYRLPTNSFAAWINAIRAARAKSDAGIATLF
ncbi:ATP-binding protein [Devosia alba]|uniref:ATP-binding protein n=1 Tax=Devosia alba TaxID=3152360 RepID=UPI0032632040